MIGARVTAAAVMLLALLANRAAVGQQDGAVGQQDGAVGRDDGAGAVVGGGAEALPTEAVAPEERLRGALRARYLLRQLELTDAQAETAERLLADTFAEQERRPLDLEELRAVAAEFEAAKQAGDEAQMAAARGELERLAGGQDADVARFFEAFAAELTAAQQQQLADARERLAMNATGAVRPIDLYRIARDLIADREGRRALAAARAAARDQVGGAVRLSPEARVTLLNEFLERVRAVLPAARRDAFERHIRRLRPDLAGETLRVDGEATQPTSD